MELWPEFSGRRRSPGVASAPIPDEGRTPSVALHSAALLEAAAYQAECAVEIAPHSPATNLGLGLVLTAQGKNLEEAFRRLRFAAAEHPGASLAAADVLLQPNRPKEAQLDLRAFLNHAPNPVR